MLQIMKNKNDAIASILVTWPWILGEQMGFQIFPQLMSYFLDFLLDCNFFLD